MFKQIYSDSHVRLLAVVILGLLSAQQFLNTDYDVKTQYTKNLDIPTFDRWTQLKVNDLQGTRLHLKRSHTDQWVIPQVSQKSLKVASSSLEILSNTFRSPPRILESRTIQNMEELNPLGLTDTSLKIELQYKTRLETKDKVMQTRFWIGYEDRTNQSVWISIVDPSQSNAPFDVFKVAGRLRKLLSRDNIFWQETRLCFSKSNSLSIRVFPQRGDPWVLHRTSVNDAWKLDQISASRLDHTAIQLFAYTLLNLRITQSFPKQSSTLPLRTRIELDQLNTSPCMISISGNSSTIIASSSEQSGILAPYISKIVLQNRKQFLKKKLLIPETQIREAKWRPVCTIENNRKSIDVPQKKTLEAFLIPHKCTGGWFRSLNNGQWYTLSDEVPKSFTSPPRNHWLKNIDQLILEVRPMTRSHQRSKYLGQLDITLDGRGCTPKSVCTLSFSVTHNPKVPWHELILDNESLIFSISQSMSQQLQKPPI